jgi:hypothetical protein
MKKTNKKIIYRGSFPRPEFEHGDDIPGYGKVLGRTRTATGWEYRCKSKKTPVTIFYFQSDPLEKQLFDRKNIPIHVGDILKVFHFVAASRREKRYMYKQVIDQINNLNGENCFRISHLNEKKQCYWKLIDNSSLIDCEIVQGYDDFRERQKR